MPSIPLYPRTQQQAAKSHGLEFSTTITNPLPNLLQTPSGLAILELQGTINVPSPETNDGDGGEIHEPKSESLPQQSSKQDAGTSEIEIGKLMFPDYKPDLYGQDDTKWMKRVYLYVGKYQRLTGEVKKLGKPLAVIRRVQQQNLAGQNRDHSQRDGGDELEVVEIIKYKILFPSRPEPVGLEE